jgi:hypothetical protein
MQIKSLKDLSNLMKVCRQNGVRTMKIEGFEFTLENDVPQKPMKASKQTPDSELLRSAGIITEDTGIKTDMPTLDQLIDWSAGAQGVPTGVPTPETNT